jgi:hypothetical protein
MTEPAQPSPVPVDYLECARMDIRGNSFLSGDMVVVYMDDVDAAINTLKAERDIVRRHEASHSLFSQQQEPALINPNDRRTCQFQEIQCYPGDEFVMCHSSEKCEYQHPSSVPPDIFCNKEVISYESAIAAAAIKQERERIREAAIKINVSRTFLMQDILAIINNGGGNKS